MARRFQKVDPNCTVVSVDGEINGPKDVNLLVGSKWAVEVAKGTVTEIEPDDSLSEESENAAINGLGVETFTPAAAVVVTAEAVGTGNGVLQDFTHTCASLPVDEGSLVAKVDGASVATDNGKGILSGTGVSGTINYHTGAMTLHFDTAPADTLAITAAYNQETVITLAGAPVTVADSKMKVLKNSVALVRGAGAGKYLAIDQKKIALGTGANGTDKYVVAYLTK